MKKRNLLIYRIVTALFSLMIMGGVSQYFFNHEVVKGMFEALEFPTYLIYPMGIAKTLGIVAIWTNLSKRLKEWAYAGFVFNMLLGISAHLNAADGGFMASTVVLVLVIVSYIFYRKIEAEAEAV